MRPVVVQLLALAEQYYASGDRGLYYLAPRCAFSVHTARLVYSRIGARLAARGHDVLGERARVGTTHKLGLCARAGFATSAISVIDVIGSCDAAVISVLSEPIVS